MSPTPITSVEISAVALLRIVRHCEESLPDLVCGSLLGADGPRGKLEVTGSFPVAHPSAAQDTASDSANHGSALSQVGRHDPRDPYKHAVPSLTSSAEGNGEGYREEMLEHLRCVNADGIVVGWYCASRLGAFLTETTLAAQFEHQCANPAAVMVVYDPPKSQEGHLCVSAYRLTEAFMSLMEDRVFTLDALRGAGVGFADMVAEVPVSLTASQLGRALLVELGARRGLSCDHERLTFGANPYLEKNMESLIEAVDELHQKHNNLQHYHRSFERQRAGIAAALARRRQRNAELRALGEQEIPEDDLLNQKLIPEPPRLESLIVSSQVGSHCQKLNEFAGQSFSRLFLASRFLQQPKA